MIKIIYLFITLVYLNAACFGLAQIKPLQANFAILLVSIFFVALPVALFWREILFTKNGKSQVVLD